MSTLAVFLADYLRRELRSAVDSDNGLMLRCFFSGPPPTQLNSLFDELTHDNGFINLELQDRRISVLVYQVDPNAADPIGISSSCKGSEEGFVGAIRNNRSIPYCIVLQAHVSGVQSLDSTVTRLGVARYHKNLSDWLAVPLIRELLDWLEDSFSGLASRERLQKAFNDALERAWEVDDKYSDRRTTWEVLSHLADLTSRNDVSLDLLCATLGLFRATEEAFGTDSHLSATNSVSGFFDSAGLNAGFSLLESEASPEIQASLEKFRSFIEDSGVIDASGFSRNTLGVISGAISDREALPDWWLQLDIAIWAALLDFEQPDVDSTTSLVVSPIGSIKTKSKALPVLFHTDVVFQVSAPDNESELEVEISRANGTAAFQTQATQLLTDGHPFLYEDDSVPKHQRYVRYKISAPGFGDAILKCISLRSYGPGVVLDCAAAKTVKLFSLNKKATDSKGQKLERYETDLYFPSMGAHQVDLYFGENSRISDTLTGYEIDSEQDAVVSRRVNSQSSGHGVCLIETDEECHYEFVGDVSGEATRFRIYLSAGDEAPKGVESEFDRLVLSNLAASSGDHSSARVEPSSNRRTTLEEWILDSDQSSCPLIFGPDFLDCWAAPSWGENPLLSRYPALIDPRPEGWRAKVPEGFLAARSAVLEAFRQRGTDGVPNASLLAMHEYMRDEGFVSSLLELLRAYVDWLREDYETAIWADTISIIDRQASVDALESEPRAILLTPFHPIRLAWQCNAQHVMQSALEMHEPCPAASAFTPAAFPDCLLMTCATATGQINKVSYLSMKTSNDYWSVMWATSQSATSARGSVFDAIEKGLGIAVEGVSSGFSSQQVVRAMNEVAKLMPGRSTLSVSVTSDEDGGSEFNEGFSEWCVTNLGPERDAWGSDGSRSLVVSDRRSTSQHPEQSVLSSLTRRTDGAIRWYTSNEPRIGQDLSIISHLGTMSHEFSVQGIRSAIDRSGLVRRRLRKQQSGNRSAFVSESLVGELPDFDALQPWVSGMLAAVDVIEAKCADEVDSYVFAPNLAVLGDVVRSSAYTAVSSSNVDAACFFGSTQRAYLWDYELPSYSRRTGGSNGYFLLASQSEGMLRAVRSALGHLGSDVQYTDEHIANMLEEISRRGMPTLKRLTAGGTVSMGEIGMLIALKVLQYDFSERESHSGLIPVMESSRSINLVVPADPFQGHFESLRRGLQQKAGERPDMLVASISFSPSGQPETLRLTAIEVKAREGVMKAKDRAGALTQARHFSNFLTDLQTKAKSSEIWGVAWRDLLASIIDYGFRVYGQLENLMSHSSWTTKHQATLKRLGDEGLRIEVEAWGRLIVIDGSPQSFPCDVDSDSFKETIVLSKEDALKILSADAPKFLSALRASLGTWGLVPFEGAGANAGDDQEQPQIATQSISRGEGASPNTELEALSDEEYAHEDSGAPLGIETSSLQYTETSQGTTTYDNEKTLETTGRNQETLSTTTSTSDSINVARGIKFPVGKTVGSFKEEELDFFPGNTALNQLNIGVVGDLGTGKTQLIKALIRQLRFDQSMNRGKTPNVLIFDYKRDYSQPAFVKAVGAKVIAPFNIPLNLFDTRDSIERPNQWLERSKFFIDILSKIYQGIGPKQREYIKQSVKEAYDRAKAMQRPAPSVAEVFECYKEARGDQIDAPYSIMSDLVDGGYFVDDPEKVVPFSEFLDGVVVIDLSAVGADDRTKNMLVAIFLNLFYEHMLKIEKQEFIGVDPTLRFVDTMLLVDEADNIMKYEFDVLKQILLQGREFGVGVLLASQYLSHYKTTHENYMEPLLTWFIHKVPQITVSELERVGLQNPDAGTVNSIKALECHECLYKSLGVDGRLIRGTPFYELDV